VPARATRRPPHSTRNRERVLASVPAVPRRQVDKWAEARLTAKFSQLLEMRARDPERFTVYRGLTAAECFKEIEGNEIFWPTT